MKPHIAYDYSNHAAILVWSPWILCDIILYEIEYGNIKINPITYVERPIGCIKVGITKWNL